MSIFAVHALVSAHAGPPPAMPPARGPMTTRELARLDRESETARQMRDLNAALLAELNAFFPEGCADG